MNKEEPYEMPKLQDYILCIRVGNEIYTPADQQKVKDEED